MKTHIDLFSGIGGFALAAEWSGITTVAHSEVEKYACKVYHRHFPASVCLGDITTIDWSKHESPFLLTGGFPCQPHSVAGKRKASADERDLWSECVRALGGLRPRYAIFENVAGLFTSDGGRFFNRILSDVASLGYDAEWRVLSAADVGAPHRRERVWIVAHSPDAGITRGEREPGVDAKEGGGRVHIGSGDGSENVVYSRGDGQSAREITGGVGQRGLDRTTGEVEACEPTGSGGGEDVADSSCRENDKRERSRMAEKSGSGRRVNPTVVAGGEDVADSTSNGRKPRRESNTPEEQGGRESGGGGVGEDVPHPEVPRLEGPEPERGARTAGRATESGSRGRRDDWWTLEPNVGRVDHGIPSRVDRLKGLGNAIVPQCAYRIMQDILRHAEQRQ